MINRRQLLALASGFLTLNLFAKEANMKKILIIGANGKSGSALVNEALTQGYEVSAIVRNKEYKNDKLKNIIYKDILAITKEDLANFDIVISAFAAWTEETFPLHKKVAEHLRDLLANTKTRLFIVGGAGTLFVDKEMKVRVMDTPEFPADWQGVAKATADSLEVMKNSQNLLWTYVSPAGNYDAEGSRTGKYVLGTDFLILNSQNESYISYADLAVAIIDEIKNEQFIQKRFTAITKQ